MRGSHIAVGTQLRYTPISSEIISISVLTWKSFEAGVGDFFGFQNDFGDGFGFFGHVVADVEFVAPGVCDKNAMIFVGVFAQNVGVSEYVEWFTRVFFDESFDGKRQEFGVI